MACYWWAIRTLHFNGYHVLVTDSCFYWCTYVGMLLTGFHGYVRFTLGIAHFQKDTITLKPPVLHQWVSDLHPMDQFLSMFIPCIHLLYMFIIEYTMLCLVLYNLPVLSLYLFSYRTRASTYPTYVFIGRSICRVPCSACWFDQVALVKASVYS